MHFLSKFQVHSIEFVIIITTLICRTYKNHLITGSLYALTYFSPFPSSKPLAIIALLSSGMKSYTEKQCIISLTCGTQKKFVCIWREKNTIPVIVYVDWKYVLWEWWRMLERISTLQHMYNMKTDSSIQK